IKRKKGKTDVQRGKLFSKILREITVAARNGGGDPKGNVRLKAATEAARAANMPADNIKRAIQKGTGELPGEQYEEITYEGYGPPGAGASGGAGRGGPGRHGAAVHGAGGGQGCGSGAAVDRGARGAGRRPVRPFQLRHRRRGHRRHHRRVTQSQRASMAPAE